MLDKFMQLTYKILKVLGLSYYESVDTDARGNNIYKLYFIDSNPKSKISILMPYSDYQILIKEIGIHTEDDYVWERLSVDIYNNSISYMNTIYSLFDRYSAIAATDPSNTLYIKRYTISDNISDVLDELLKYSDEEFKLYISLL